MCPRCVSPGPSYCRPSQTVRQSPSRFARRSTPAAPRRQCVDIVAGCPDVYKRQTDQDENECRHQLELTADGIDVVRQGFGDQAHDQATDHGAERAVEPAQGDARDVYKRQLRNNSH